MSSPVGHLSMPRWHQIPFTEYHAQLENQRAINPWWVNILIIATLAFATEIVAAPLFHPQPILLNPLINLMSPYMLRARTYKSPSHTICRIQIDPYHNFKRLRDLWSMAIIDVRWCLPLEQPSVILFSIHLPCWAFSLQYSSTFQKLGETLNKKMISQQVAWGQMKMS